jgi:hypothetical protein
MCRPFLTFRRKGDRKRENDLATVRSECSFGPGYVASSPAAWQRTDRSGAKERRDKGATKNNKHSH